MACMQRTSHLHCIRNLCGQGLLQVGQHFCQILHREPLQGAVARVVAIRIQGKLNSIEWKCMCILQAFQTGHQIFLGYVHVSKRLLYVIQLCNIYSLAFWKVIRKFLFLSHCLLSNDVIDVSTFPRNTYQEILQLLSGIAAPYTSVTSSKHFLLCEICSNSNFDNKISKILKSQYFLSCYMPKISIAQNCSPFSPGALK